MTATAEDAGTRGLAVPRIVDVGGVPMSALVRLVPEPRAVIVALHGGAASAHYYHYPEAPRLWLLETGAALGFSVIALDRPGYGAVEALLGTDRRGAGLLATFHRPQPAKEEVPQ